MKTLFLSLLTCAALLGSAPKFSSPTGTFSHKKSSFITLVDGSEIECKLKNIDIKKGMIEEIKVENADGKKVKIKPEEVSHMYLPPSGLDKAGKMAETLSDATKWNDQSLNQDLLQKKYAYFETSKVKIKKKEYTLMMQLLNPSFCKAIKVYADPMAGETTSFGVAGVKVAGGDEKSYYIKVGDGVAYKVAKKTYEEEYVKLWKDCPSLMEKKDKIKWTELNEHIIEYSECLAK